MQKEKGISSSVGILIIIVIAIIAFGGVFAYQYFAPKTQPVVQTQQTQNTGNKSPIIEGISIEKPNLVVKGQNLSKVQIYFVPTGTGIDPETMSRIENAVKQSETDGNQVWTYRYPSDLLITNIFAKGFDEKGNLVKEVDLPIVGASALADALYGDIIDQTTTKQISDDIVIAALNKLNGFQLVKNAQGHYSAGPLAGSYIVDSITKGDLNNDNFEDAFVQITTCGASCGSSFTIIINKNGSSADVFDVVPAGFITSGAGQYGIKNISINNGILTINANIYNGNSTTTSQFNYKLVGKKLVKI